MHKNFIKLENNLYIILPANKGKKWTECLSDDFKIKLLKLKCTHLKDNILKKLKNPSRNGLLISDHLVNTLLSSNVGYKVNVREILGEEAQSVIWHIKNFIFCKIKNLDPGQGCFLGQSPVYQQRKKCIDTVGRALIDLLFRLRDEHRLNFEIIKFGDPRPLDQSYKTAFPSHYCFTIHDTTELLFAFKASERSLMRIFKRSITQNHFLYPCISRKDIGRCKYKGEGIAFPDNIFTLASFTEGDSKIQFTFYYKLKTIGEVAVIYTLQKSGVFDLHLRAFDTYESAFQRISSFALAINDGYHQVSDEIPAATLADMKIAEWLRAVLAIREPEL